MSETPFRVGAGPESLAEPHDDLFAEPTVEERASVSPMEGLRSALAEPTVSEPITLRVPKRPGVKIRCRTDVVDHDKRKAWQNKAKRKQRGIGREPEVDELHFAMLVVANTCEAVQFNGLDAYDEEGTPLTFRHAQLWEMLGARDPQEAIRKFFDNDQHIILASGEVLLASGFDDDLSDEEGPTRG